jgi:DNA polymerase-3 subunit gamma/tau
MVSRHSKRTAAVVREASVRDVDGETIVLLFRHSVHASMLATDTGPLLDAVHEVVGGTWQVRCEAADNPGAATAPLPAAGGSGSESMAAGAPAGAAVADDGWPEPARLGGDPEPGTIEPGGRTFPPGGASAPARGRGGHTGGGQAGGQAPGGRAAGGRAGGGRAAGGQGSGGRPAGGRSSGGRAAQAAGPGGGAPVGRQRAGGSTGAGRGQATVGPSEPVPEPPYDPEVDGAAGAQWEGFDPGDEPTDEVIDERAASQTSEEQAVRLLQQTLDAEHIGDA